jgi:hypothetical protein
MHKLIAIIFLFFMLAGACQKKEDIIEDKTNEYIPLISTGELLDISAENSLGTTTVLIDSDSNYFFTLRGYSFSNENSVGRFFLLEMLHDRQVYILQRQNYFFPEFSVVMPAVFEKGQAVGINANQDIFMSWIPEENQFLDVNVYIKYEIFTSTQQGIVRNLNIGDNYVVFKFGEPGAEHMGWLNIEYLDTTCRIKEGYFNKNPNADIIVGER